MSHSAIVKLPVPPEACVIPCWEKNWGKRKGNFKLQVGCGMRNERCSPWRWATLARIRAGRSGGAGRAREAAGTDGLSPAGPRGVSTTLAGCPLGLCGGEKGKILNLKEGSARSRVLLKKKRINRSPWVQFLSHRALPCAEDVESRLYESL